MDKLSLSQNASPFDTIRQIENGIEFWSARDLQALLDYKLWQNFEKTIERAMISCKVAGHEVSDHFIDLNKTIPMPKGARKQIKDYHLTRFACYSIAMNGDVEKPSIAQAQTYFNIQVRRAELARQQASASRPQINSLWEKRALLFNERTHIPEGYWCIFNEIVHVCWGMEMRGEHL